MKSETLKAPSPSLKPILAGISVAPRLMLIPASFLIGILIVCSFAVLRLSFGTQSSEWTNWSIESYLRLATGRNIALLFDTLWMALLSAALATAVALPIALYMSRTASDTGRRIMLVGILLPMIISVLVQSFGWIAILGPNGLVNQAAISIFGEGARVSLLYNRLGVILGLVQTTVPLAVLPIVASLNSIPRELEEAANILGANRLKTYLRVILPLAKPGMVTGSVLVFGFNTGAFVVPLLLGGMKVSTVAVAIRDQMGSLMNWPLGAAFSIVLVVLAILIQMTNRFVVSDQK